MKYERNIQKPLILQIYTLSIFTIMLVIVLFITSINLLEKSNQCNSLETEKMKLIDERDIIKDNYNNLIETVEQLKSEPKEVESFDVIITNYHTEDGSSSTRTGSGLSINNFKVNELGWYTYYGKVVVATATYQGLKSDYGILKQFSEEVDSINYFNYFDTFKLEISGKEYECIVLDTCGASMNEDYLIKYDNGLNRIDIFISDKAYAFGKIKGTVKKLK